MTGRAGTGAGSGADDESGGSGAGAEHSAGIESTGSGARAGNAARGATGRRGKESGMDHDLGPAMRGHLERAERHNGRALDAAATLLYDRIAAGGIVLAGGSGHSLALVLETFYRAGGLACVHPLVTTEIMPLFGARASTVAERRTGIAAEVVAAARPDAGDVGVIFSNSGANPYPVELAVALRAHDVPVIAMVSGPSMAAAPTRAERKLGALADVLLDTLVPAGDAAYPAEEPRTAALSSLVCVFLWNLLLARLVDRAAERSGTLPLWVSSNIEGGDERNAALLERYSARIPALLAGTAAG